MSRKLIDYAARGAAVVGQGQDVSTPEAVPAITFKAWRIIGEESDPIEISATNLSAALDQAKVACVHKQVLVILETGPRRSVQHVYRIKKSTVKGFRRAALDGGPMVFEGLLEPVPVIALQVKTFEPVQRFRWSPDCDVVGIDRSMVE